MFLMNKMKVIRKSLMLLILSVCFLELTAQEKHVIFIQNENKQPFYVQLNGQTFSSTNSGFLILSQLVIGKYYLITGFPKNIYPEQKFIVDIEKYDKEFSLKKITDKDFVLVDMIDNVTLNAEKEASVIINREAEVKKPIVKKDTVAVVPEIKKEVVAEKADVAINAPVTAAAATPPVSAPAIITAPVMINTKANPKIVKIFEKVSATGVDLIFIDKTNTKTDTVAVYIPASGEKPLTRVAEPVKPTPVKATVPLDFPAVSSKPAATNEDFLKTRLDMAGATTEEEMLRAAKLSLKNKTYTTEQIKNLGVLFLSEKGKLRFFEIAKPSVSDSSQFATLQNQFTQPELAEKFNSLNKKD